MHINTVKQWNFTIYNNQWRNLHTVTNEEHSAVSITTPAGGRMWWESYKCEKAGFKKGRWLVWGVGAAKNPGLLPAGPSPAEVLLPRPAALDAPLELDDDHDLLLLLPRLNPVTKTGKNTKKGLAMK